MTMMQKILALLIFSISGLQLLSLTMGKYFSLSNLLSLGLEEPPSEVLSKSKENEFQFVEFLPNTVLLSLTNYGYIVLTKNLIMSLERLNLGKYLTVASFEKKASQSLLDMSEFTGRVHQLGSEKATQLASFGTQGFKERAGMRKILAIKWYLSRGHNVLYIDSDIAVLRDFRELFTQSDRASYDAILQDGRGSNLPTPNWFEPCTGFMYLRASSTTLNFTDLEKHAILWNKTRDDQSYLVAEFLPHWNIKQLPKAQFPTGWWLMNVIKTAERLKELSSAKPGTKDDLLYLVHMNYMKGGHIKAQRHREFGTLFYKGPDMLEFLGLDTAGARNPF